MRNKAAFLVACFGTIGIMAAAAVVDASAGWFCKDCQNQKAVELREYRPTRPAKQILSKPAVVVPAGEKVATQPGAQPATQPIAHKIDDAGYEGLKHQTAELNVPKIGIPEPKFTAELSVAKPIQEQVSQRVPQVIRRVQYPRDPCTCTIVSRRGFFGRR